MNKAKSIQARLLNLSKERTIDYNYTLIRYGIERLVYRINQSRYRDRFLLKGAMLFLLWQEDTYRPTKDLDLLGTGKFDAAELYQVFHEIVSAEVPDDGVTFDSESIDIEEIRDGELYHGYRINLKARLGSARIKVQVDVGLGDIIYPEPKDEEFPSLLDHHGPMIKAYPKEAMLSEKFDALLALGSRNSRMKDYFDMYVLIRDFDFNGAILSQALAATILRRGRVLPTDIPTGLQSVFETDAEKQAQWEAFIRRIGLSQSGVSLSTVLIALRAFFVPIIEAWSETQEFSASWIAGGPWT